MRACHRRAPHTRPRGHAHRRARTSRGSFAASVGDRRDRERVERAIGWRRCAIRVEHRAHDLRDVVGATELDERAGLARARGAVLGEIAGELRATSGAAASGSPSSPSRRGRHEPQLGVAWSARGARGCRRRARRRLRPSDRLDGGAADRAVGAAERLAQRARSSRARSPPRAIRIGRRVPRDPHAPRARDRVLRTSRSTTCRSGSSTIDDLRRRRPGLAAVAREQPAQVDAIVVGHELERRRGERRASTITSRTA